jgi:hypothetical protein
MLATNLRHGLRHPAHAGRGGNPNQRRFRPLGDVPLFEKMLRINGLGDILAVESGYEEGCFWGANKPPLRNI